MTSANRSRTAAGFPSRRVAISALAIAWAALAVLAAIAFAGRIPDDMYITFRYSWNLAHGEGFVFNPGERVFALTNPGHGLVLGLLHAVTRIPVHWLAAGIFAVSLWLLVLLCWREGRARRAGVEIAVGGSLVLLSSYVWTGIGSASASVLLLLVAAAGTIRNRPRTAGVLAGLAVWYRPDALLGVAALGCLVWIRDRRIPWRWALITGAVVASGVVAAWLWFGTPLPVTLEAKRIMAQAWGGAWAGPMRFWAREGELLTWHYGRAWQLLVAIGLAGQWPLFARGGLAVRTLVLYGAAVAVLYPVLRVPFFHWYTVPPFVALLLGAGAFPVGVGRAVRDALTRGPEDLGPRVGRARKPWGGAVVALTASVILVPVLWTMLPASWGRARPAQVHNRYDTFREAGIWIREHSLPEHRIAYGEIGNLAYWSRRPVDDLVGLASPRLLPYLAKHDGAGAFLAVAPEFFLDHAANTHRGVVKQPWFARAYHPVARIENPGGGEEAAIVFRKRPGVDLPPARPPKAPRPARPRR